jgi:EAL domain-containing protein (putative c-di-GMP-specific phosphodiesterase class I)/GGDEF domain-containing protein
MKTQSFIVESSQSLESYLRSQTPIPATGILIQLFSDCDPDVASSLARILLKAHPDAMLIGMSSEQLIDRGGILMNQTLVIMTYFFDTRLTSTVVPYNNDPDHASNQMIAALRVNSNTQAAICFADRFEYAVRATLPSFFNNPPPFPIAGGASSKTQHGQWVIHGDQTYSDAFVAVALHSPNLYVEVNGFTEWYPLGSRFIVTQAKGCVVQSIDNKPVSELYNRYLGDDNNVPFELIKNFPFIVGDELNQDIYSPIKAADNGGILFDKEIPEGTQVQFCYNHPSLSLEKIFFHSQKLAQSAPESLFIYNCVSRLSFIEGNSELQPLQSVTDTFGVYCMGEICRLDDKQRVLHHSLTYLALREGECAPQQERLNASPQSYAKAVSPIFSLIRHSLLDLDERNHSMAEQIKQQAEMQTHSYRIDRHTGLPNRLALRQRLEKFEIQEHLLTLKLTGFSRINEKYGYVVGDKLLLDISEYFQNYIEDKDYTSFEVFAIGVGEWAVVFTTDLDDYRMHFYFSEFADSLENVNFEPFGLPEIEYLSVSVNGGLVSRRDFPNHPIDNLLLKSVEARRFADENNKRFYNANELVERDEKRVEQLSWLSFVSRAILNDNVIPFAQPIFNASDHSIASYECLVRIQDEGDIILPGRFLPIIEGTHLYTRLSRQMITKTFQIMKHRTESFSINLAPQDFMSDRTLEHLEQAIKQIDDPSRVGIEVLETEQIKDYAHMIEVCNQLRRLGARIIIDDFGSGYSNIDEIIKLEPQVIKIDGSLIRNIDTNLRQRHITQQLIKLCHVLNAKTVAEFVHNAEICRIVENMGIDYIQGYHLGEPVLLK